MDNKPRVFRIPDGKGGTKYQIMTKDGQWLDTDEDGNTLGKEEEAPATMPQEQSRGKGLGKNCPGHVFMSIKMTQEDYEILSKYVYWHSLNREPLSRSALAYRLLMDHIRKDRDFQEFRKRNGKV